MERQLWPNPTHSLTYVRLELESFDPRGLIIPPNPLLHSLTVHDVPDADVWVEELLIDTPEPGAPQEGSTNGYTITPLESPSDAVPRFPNLRFLSLHHTSLLSLPTVPLDSLTHLDLSHNLLNAIPDALRGLHSLVSLNLAHNLITSVRNAPQALGNIHTINLAHNRIDCLVGLDRVPGLRRVDVRGNELTEPGEVGRLAVLPLVEAMWAAENPLAHGDDWRPEISAAFAAEGRPVVLDDTPLAWSEQRRVDAILASRGRTRAKERTQQLETPAQARVQQQGQRASPSVPTDEPDVPSRVGSVTPPTATAIPDRVSSPPLTASAAASPTKVAAAHRKRPRRRLVNLDGDEIASLNASTSTVGTTTTATPTLTPKTKGKKDGKKEKKDKSSRKNGNGNGSGNGSADSVAAKDSVGE
jgi:hypothetical protein